MPSPTHRLVPAASKLEALRRLYRTGHSWFVLRHKSLTSISVRNKHKTPTTQRFPQSRILLVPKDEVLTIYPFRERNEGKFYAFHTEKVLCWKTETVMPVESRTEIAMAGSSMQ